MITPDRFRSALRRIRWGYAHLTAILFALILLRPVLETKFVIQLFGIAIMIAAWAVTGNMKRVRKFLIVLASLTAGVILLSASGDLIVGTGSAGAVNQALVASYVALLIYCGIMLLVSLLYRRQIVMNDILGAISLYLILGYIWAFIYTSLELVSPGSFRGLDIPAEPAAERLSAAFGRLSYFSFITLATQGYGDITPQTTWAETFVMLQTMTGQLYVALVLAYLLSTHLMTSQETTNQ